jgi:hypothetical protein
MFRSSPRRGLNSLRVTDRKNTCCNEFELASYSTGVSKWTHREYWQPLHPYATIVWEF